MTRELLRFLVLVLLVLPSWARAETFNVIGSLGGGGAAAAGTLTGTTLASNVVTASLTTINGNTVPTAVDTFALLAATQVLTNKTINIASNTLTGVAPLASPTFSGTVTFPDASTWGSGGISSGSVATFSSASGTGAIRATGGQAATTVTTGAIVVAGAGGLGVGGQVWSGTGFQSTGGSSAINSASGGFGLSVTNSLGRGAFIASSSNAGLTDLIVDDTGTSGFTSFAIQNQGATKFLFQWDGSEVNLITVVNTPMMFYTNNTLRGQFTAAGVFNTAGAASIAGTLTNPGITPDTAQTDSTVCQSTTTHQYYSGTGTLGACLGTSGRQFKTAFAPMTAGLAEIARLELQNFRYLPGYGDGGARLQYGLVAQDVEKVLPDLAGHDATGATINYDSGAVLMISLRAIQELKADNDNMRAEIETLRRGSAR